MKRLRNSTKLPDTLVREVVEWIADELGISGFDVECRNLGGRGFAGTAYVKGCGYHSSHRPFVVLRIGTKETRFHQDTINSFTGAQVRHCGNLRQLKHLNPNLPITRTVIPAWPFLSKPYQYAQHKGKRYPIANATEALVYIAAHELRHLWQAARWSDKRKSKPLPLAFGAKGKFSEIDTEAFAIHMLRAWRKRPAAC